MSTPPRAGHSPSMASAARNATLRHRVRAFWDSPRLDDPRFLRRVWTAGRVLLLLEWAAMLFTLGDTRYYHENIVRMAEVGPRATMVEYPTPVLWLLKLPDLFSLGHRAGYVVAFVALMMLLDAAFTRSLWRAGGRLRGRAVAFWAAFVPLVGTTAYLRFDIVTAVLAGWALLLLRRRRPPTAGALVGIGAAIKLWPALLWPALLVRRRTGESRGRVLATIGFWGAGCLLALVSLLWAGWDRLVSPLTWQGQRGLQIESVWASVPMLRRMLDPHAYWVAVSDFNAWEISGPGTGWFSMAATVATGLGLVGCVAAYLVWLRRDGQRLVEAAALMLLVVLVMIVTNKTFSPQYIIWAGGPLAAGWAVADGSGQQDGHLEPDHRRLAEVSGWMLLVTLLTQLVYPIGYASLVGHRPGMVLATLVLVARNAVLCWALVTVGRWVWHFLRRREDPAVTAPADAPLSRGVVS